MGTIQWRYTGSDGTQRLWHIPQRRPHRRCRAGRASWNAVRAIQTRGARPKISRMGFARNRPRPHYAPGFDAAPHRRTADPGTHRSNQSLLLQLKRRSRASATGLPARPRKDAPPRPVPPAFLAMSRMALIQGHGGVGIVEAVGPEVRRVQAGDRVCVSGTPQCGACYQCLRGRADMCQFLGRQGPHDLVPIADMRDGTPVYANSHIGGLAELMVTFEEWVVPVFTKASAADLGMVCSCVAVAGLGCTASQVLAAIETGSIVAVVGCGPLGLSAIQGARIAGASTIIAIDPIRVRREVALKVGATHVLDPMSTATSWSKRFARSPMARTIVSGPAAAIPADCWAAPERISSWKPWVPIAPNPSSKPVSIPPAFFPFSRPT